MLYETQLEKGQILKKLSRHEAARTQTLYSSLENNRTEIHLKLTPTELRLNANYVFYYINLSRFVVSGLFPFISLTIFGKLVFPFKSSDEVKLPKINTQTLRTPQSYILKEPKRIPKEFQRIPKNSKKFPMNSQRIPKELPKNSKEL